MTRRLIASTLRFAPAGAVLAAGLAAGFWLAFKLSEEDRRRIKKGFFEMRELPRRVLV